MNNQNPGIYRPGISLVVSVSLSSCSGTRSYTRFQVLYSSTTMDPRSRHSLVQEALQYSFSDARITDTLLQNNKRHAMFFPTVVHDSSPTQDDNSSDDYSTWEFTAPAPLHNQRRNSAISSYSRTTSTPAQEMASRYRAGMPLHTVLSGPSPSNPSSSSRHDRSKRTTIKTHQSSTRNTEYHPVAPAAELKASCRQSRAEALQETSSEALRLMRNQGVSERGPIACGRVGCHDILRNLDGLMRHLHIHNLHDRAINCPRCNQTLPNRAEYSSHACRRRSRLQSLPSCATTLTSPIKDTFFRVINKINALP